MRHVLEVWSGGQTGVDRAALDVALELGIPIGGWVPRGRRAEDGRVPERYEGLREADAADYPLRTRLNVEDTDATLVLRVGVAGGGTRATLDTARRLGRPVLDMDLDGRGVADAAASVAAWLEGLCATRPVIRLNVAGPRASQVPFAHARACQILRMALAAYARSEPTWATAALRPRFARAQLTGRAVLARGDDPPMNASDPAPSTWSMVVYSLTRPYPVSIPLIVLVSLVPCYVFIGNLTLGRAVHMPALPWDRVLPLEPAWALVYGSLYLFLILLPVFVVRQPDHIRATVWAYLLVWGTAYVCFLVYPTVAPRPAQVVGTGFVDWGLRFLYTADTPYNCFPSIHVAHSFVSALTCYRVHRRVGVAATVCAALVALSTLLAKQHYIVDVLAGVALAGVAYALFLRNRPHGQVPELERRLAPVFAGGTVVIVGTAMACFWLAYRLSGGA